MVLNEMLSFRDAYKMLESKGRLGARDSGINEENMVP